MQANNHRGLLIDIDGVLAVSWEPIPGAPEALGRLRSAGVPMVFVTNTTSVTRHAIADRLHQAGFPIADHEILTAPAMTAALLRRQYPGPCWMVGGGVIAADLDGITLVSGDQHPEVVVLGGAGPAFDYATLNRVFHLAIDGTPVVAMHRNLYWRTSEGLQLDTGAFLGALEQAAGIQATVVGKPAPACFAAGVERLGLPADQVLMVGDDLDADIGGAQSAGIDGVLVRTGKFRPETLAASQVLPTLVVDSFADVPALFEI